MNQRHNDRMSATTAPLARAIERHVHSAGDHGTALASLSLHRRDPPTGPRPCSAFSGYDAAVPRSTGFAPTSPPKRRVCSTARGSVRRAAARRGSDRATASGASSCPGGFPGRRGPAILPPRRRGLATGGRSGAGQRARGRVRPGLQHDRYAARPQRLSRRAEEWKRARRERAKRDEKRWRERRKE